MKKIILTNEDSATIPFDEINPQCAIFSKDKNGVLTGMIREEKWGWILCTGATTGSTGHHETLRKCLESCAKYGHEFFT